MTARENADAKDLAGRIILIVCKEEYYPPALNSIYQQKREANSLPYAHKELFIKGSPSGRAPAIAGERGLGKNSSSVSLRLPPSPAGEGLDAREGEPLPYNAYYSYSAREDIILPRRINMIAHAPRVILEQGVFSRDSSLR